MQNYPERWAVVRGAGDLGTGVAYSLLQAGFRVITTEVAQPLVVRRTVAFAEAVYSGSIKVQGIIAQAVKNCTEARRLVSQGIVPVVVDPEGNILAHVKPMVVVDAIMAKKNTGTAITDAPVVIGLGPGLVAGKDVHAVIETCRGPYLGNIIYEGAALPNSGTPGAIEGRTWERLLKAPVAGVVSTGAKIGDMVKKDDTVAYVGTVPVLSKLDGVLRGMVHSGLYVEAGTKIGDVDPRGDESLCYRISDKALKVGESATRAALQLLKEGI
ncbi:MAG: selenium-dependent molybdenum cofactor biosynthesis protein YqeB [bacterium]|jgi:xanthine dehydrogenase accessory factor